jgi:hypothetical protein
MISKAVRSMAHSNKLSIGGDEGPECEDERSSSSGRSEAFLSLLGRMQKILFSRRHPISASKRSLRPHLELAI